MGRSTKNFRQSAKSRSGNMGARNFSQITRSEGWHVKVLNYLKVRGKSTN